MSKSRLATTYRNRWKQMIIDGEVIICGICGEAVPAFARGKNQMNRGGKGAITVDHIIPLSLGGEDDVNNMQPAHGLCNQLKGNLMPQEVAHLFKKEAA